VPSPPPSESGNICPLFQTLEKFPMIGKSHPEKFPTIGKTPPSLPLEKGSM
jgi:hypothetical protein